MQYVQGFVICSQKSKLFYWNYVAVTWWLTYFQLCLFAVMSLNGQHTEEWAVVLVKQHLPPNPGLHKKSQNWSYITIIVEKQQKEWLSRSSTASMHVVMYWDANESNATEILKRDGQRMQTCWTNTWSKPQYYFPDSLKEMYSISQEIFLDQHLLLYFYTGATKPMLIVSNDFTDGLKYINTHPHV